MFRANQRVVWISIFCAIFFTFNLPALAEQDEDFLNNPEVIAQWNLNVGSLALDEFQYLDALAYFEDAFNTSQMEKTKVRALLLKATTFATFLHSPDSALKIYQTIRKQYSNFAETAFYQEALLLFENGFYPQVIEVEKDYLRAYPHGRFQFQTEFLREQSEKIVQTKSYQRKEVKRKRTRLREKAWQEQDARRRAEIRASEREAARIRARARNRAREAARLRAENRAREAERLNRIADQEAREATRMQQEATAREKARKKAAEENRRKILDSVSDDFETIAEPTIRVLIHKSTSNLTLEGNGLVFHAEGRESRPRGRIEIKSNDGRIVQSGSRGARWGKEIKITANGPIALTYGKEKKRVRGFVMLSAKGNRIRVISHIKMESYLRGVVPAESYASWKLDALKSQAMAARTYAYDHIRSHAKKPFDVYATHRSQVYGGVDRETKKTDRAVRETRGEIITSVIKGQLRPILAMYAANSGGHTADPKKEYDPHWASPPSYLVAQEDPWSIKAGKKGWATWEYTHSRREIEKNLAKRKIRVSNLSAIQPVYIGPSGRVVTVKLMYDGGKSKTVRFRPKVTLGLGGRLNTLPDTIVKIHKKGSKFVFKGKGFGHGIGYMQHGGQEMAKAGHSYQEILQFYYPDTSIVSYWN